MPVNTPAILRAIPIIIIRFNFIILNLRYYSDFLVQIFGEYSSVVVLGVGLL